MLSRSRGRILALAISCALAACGGDSTDDRDGNGTGGGAGSATGGTGGGAGGSAGTTGTGGTGGTETGGTGGGQGGTAGSEGGTGGSGGTVDPDRDTDGDGLTDLEERELGTSVEAADTDGDGYSDYEEVIVKGFDPETNTYQFNPLVADVPKLKVTLTSMPDFYMVYTEGTQTGRTVGTDHTTSSTTGTTRSWGGSQTQAIEMTHTAGVEVSVQHEFGLLGGTTIGASLSYEFSYSSTNETSTNWSSEQQQENSDALTQMEQTEESSSVDVTGGRIRTTVRVANEGDIAFQLEGLGLSSWLHNPQNPLALGALGNLGFDGGTFQPMVIQPASQSVPLTFTADVDLPTIKRLLADSQNLVIAPSTYVLKGEGGVSLELNATNIRARTAEVIIDYGPERQQEQYRVATIVDRAQPGVTVRKVLQDYLRIPYAVGTGLWRHGSETVPTESFQGLTSVRGFAMDDDTSSYWIAAHTYPIDNGASTRTDYYNLILDGYDLEDIVLQKGHVLHLVRVQDADRDGLGDRSELVYGTDPLDPDTDADGCGDSLEVGGWEIPVEGGGTRRVFPSPLHADTDRDGISDCDEYHANPRTNPVEAPRNNPPAINTATVTSNGLQATLDLAFSDPDRGDAVESVVIHWGDSTADEVLTIPAGQTTRSVGHTYTQLGSYTISVMAYDGTDTSPIVTRSITLTVPTSGLLAYWPLNGTAGDAVGPYDASFSNNSWATDRFGFGSKAADLNQGNAEFWGLITAPHLPMGTSFTISVWANGSSTGNTERIVGQGNWFNLYFSSSNKVAFGLLDGSNPSSTNVRVVDSGTHPANAWTHYAGVVEAGVGQSTVRLYKNGVQVATQTYNQTFANPNSCLFFMGMPDSGGNFCTDTQADEFSGLHAKLDDVRVYNRALNAGEIQLLSAEPDTHAVTP